MVVKGLCVYHYNPSNVEEIFRKSFWIGLSLRARYSKNKVELLKILLKRLFDIAPITGVFLIMFNAPFILTELFLLSSFMAVSFRMKILKANSLKEAILLKLFYAPAYRLVKSLGIWLGFLRSLVKEKYVTGDCLSSGCNISEDYSSPSSNAEGEKSCGDHGVDMNPRAW